MEASDTSPPRSLPPLLSLAAQTLERLASQSTLNDNEWDQVARAAQTIADGLKNDDLRTSLGTATEAIPAIGKLMVQSIEGGSVEVRMQLCRVVGNACFDHDRNRKLVLDANIPLLISKIIDSATRREEGLGGEARWLTVQELKMLRASVGAILNSSLKFDPIRKELAQSTILRSLLSLVDNRPHPRSARPVYFVGMHSVSPITQDTEDEWEERLELGETIAGWTMNVLEDVLSEDNSQFPSEEGIPILASILLSVPIFSPSSPSSTDGIPSLSNLSLAARTNGGQPDDEESSLDTSIELLSIAAALLEGLTLDHSVHKQTIALSTYDRSSSSRTSSLLHRLLEFIEFASPPKVWTKTRQEGERLEKTFQVVKAATVRAVVESTNDDLVMHELWKLGEEGSEEKKKNWLIEKLVTWLDERGTEGNSTPSEGQREDLVVCASHMLAGLGRSDRYVERLVHNYGLVKPLAATIRARVPAALVPAPNAGTETNGQGSSRAGENTQILYGVVSLMRHLAIPLKNRPIVSATRIIPTISQLLSSTLDIVKPLQMSVVGLLKHLTSLNVENSLDVLSTSAQGSGQSPLDLILALVGRTDELQLRSESTRILINLVRSLFSNSNNSPTSSEEQEANKTARDQVLKEERIVNAVSEQVRLSEKYPVLVNEGIVALSLLAGSGGERGASIVLSTLLYSRPTAQPSLPSATIEEAGEADDLDASNSTTLATRQPPKRTASLSLSPSGDPPTSLDMLIRYLDSVSPPPPPTTNRKGERPNIRPEMVSNVCTLLITVIKNSSLASAEERRSVCERLKVQLEKSGSGGGEGETRSGKEWEGVEEAIRVLRRVLAQEE